MKTKKILALLLAVVMTLALGTAAFADSTGSITVTNSVENQTYDVYKLFDLTYTDGSVAYTYTKTGENDALFAALTGTASPFTLTQVGTSNVYNVKSTASAADISTFVGTLLSADPAVITKVATGEGNGDELTFSDLAYGYYFVKSSLGAVVSIDSTLPNVEIIDKNQEPSWDNGENNPGKVIVENGQKVTKNDAAFGDVVDFDIGVNTTNFVGEKQIVNFFVKDTIDPGFDYVMNNGALDVVVKVGDTTLASSAYSVAMGEDGHSFEITVPWVNADGESLYPAAAELHVEYSATVNNEAAIAGDGNLNKANFTYQTCDPDTPDTPDDKKPYDDQNEKTTTTYVYALGIQKVDETGAPLANAKFTIAGVTANATTTAGVYEYAADGAVTEFVTNADGQIIIKGVDAGTYTVTETEAPDGYNLLTAPVTVEAALASVSSYTTTYTVYYDEDGNIVSENEATTEPVVYTFDVNVAELTVVNHSGTELPSTGGIGTTIFYIAGSLLVLAAGILLITKKRMSAEG